MTVAKFPDNEDHRQKAVDTYKLLNTLPEETYDNITSITSYILDAPISLITLLDYDRNFFKSHKGTELNEWPRKISFCAHAILSESDITIVEDAREDERFADNPFVTEHDAVFYAGVPLVNPQGYKLGTLCVFDHIPRQLDDAQIKALKTLAKQVVILFEKHLQNMQLLQLQDKLEKRNTDLKKYTDIVSHDLKSPLANIISLTDLLAEENRGILNKSSLEYIDYLKTSSYALKDYIDGLYTFYENDELLNRKKEVILFSDLINIIKKISDNKKDNITYNYDTETEYITANKSILLQVLVNLVTNAIKYNEKPEVKIEIFCKDTKDYYHFIVKDNGNGIPAKFIPTIFDLFEVVGEKDRYGNIGSGIGLAAVKKLINNQDGEISFESEEGISTSFNFTIAKN
ncbi:GAF domain-containing sensor histidine kinase [Bizionia gelidisalsuginis]|uniref:histidine kinase n=1 Tax=Bizionia gelidisalsuginis TaxID=291188 RepID=A0ABY3MEP4_9FLAO|nr:GAF domain-containing sensor histidine kinase [Bizionia gelidisalsuginis]TYC18047.1 GAF domain-containing sensor histidine kinase [Bizionia gelidisalsuginis]